MWYVTITSTSIFIVCKWHEECLCACVLCMLLLTGWLIQWILNKRVSEFRTADTKCKRNKSTKCKRVTFLHTPQSTFLVVFFNVAILNIQSIVCIFDNELLSLGISTQNYYCVLMVEDIFHLTHGRRKRTLVYTKKIPSLDWLPETYRLGVELPCSKAYRKCKQDFSHYLWYWERILSQ